MGVCSVDQGAVVVARRSSAGRPVEVLCHLSSWGCGEVLGSGRRWSCRSPEGLQGVEGGWAAALSSVAAQLGDVGTG